MIETEGLTKAFSGLLAVEDVNLRVAPGEVLALLGPNGAGKTTTVRMLTAILRPTRGRALVAGWDVSEHPNRVRLSVGVLTEQHGLYDRMTAQEYLRFFGRIYRLSGPPLEKRIQELLAYFGLTEATHRMTETFYKGMRQKLALARALLHDPPVLLLDEPTSAMDPESAQLVREEIARLRTQSRAILLCTHNLAEAEMLADRIAIIRRGRIVLQGSPEALKRTLLGQPPYDLLLAEDWPLPAAWPEGVEVIHAAPRRVRLRIPQPKQTNPRLLAWLLARQAPVLALQEVPQSLEEMYLVAMAQAQEVQQ